MPQGHQIFTHQPNVKENVIAHCLICKCIIEEVLIKNTIVIAYLMYKDKVTLAKKHALMMRASAFQTNANISINEGHFSHTTKTHV